MSRKKNRFSRLEMSINAHKRLGIYHNKQYARGNDKSGMLCEYHAIVNKKQRKLRRVLTPEERQKEFENVRYFWHSYLQ